MSEMSQTNLESRESLFFDSIKTTLNILSSNYSINTSDFCKRKLILSYFLKTFN